MKYSKTSEKILSTTNTSITVYNLNQGEVYRFNVKAVDLAGNTSPLSNRVVVVPAFEGLNYKYYEGNWSVLPDFDALTPSEGRDF